MDAFITQKSNYLKNTTFKEHSNGNYGMYGLNFLGSRPVIKINDVLWIFLWYESGTEKTTFVNANGELYTFEPREFYYGPNRNSIMQMEEYKDI